MENWFVFLGKSGGLCCRLTDPCPRSAEIRTLGKDVFEINRSEITFETRLGAGMFGEVWKGSDYDEKIVLRNNSVFYFCTVKIIKTQQYKISNTNGHRKGKNNKTINVVTCKRE